MIFKVQSNLNPLPTDVVMPTECYKHRRGVVRKVRKGVVRKVHLLWDRPPLPPWVSLELHLPSVSSRLVTALVREKDRVRILVHGSVADTIPSLPSPYPLLHLG